MADIRCPHCGKDNPDFFDVCQFCQSPLSPEAMVHIGDEPTKKDTGELEEILPDWLKDARKQGKNVEAADDVFRSQTRPKVPKDEPPDLLAGLMSQAESDEDEVPDWLASINPVAEKKIPTSKPANKEEPSDFFAQFKAAEHKPTAPIASEPEQVEMPISKGMEEAPSEPAGQKDELVDWFSQPSAEPGTTIPPDASGNVAAEVDWLKGFASFDAAEEKAPPEKEREDLSWLHDLEASAKDTDDLPEPQKGGGFDFAASSSDEDLNWLNNLGGTAPGFEEPVSSQPSSDDEGLSWLDNLGGTSISQPEERALSQPASSDDDLGWLKNLEDTPASVPSQPAASQPSSSDEELNWLNNLGGTPAAAFDEPVSSQPSSSDEDLSWLDNLGGTPVSQSEDTLPSPAASSDEDLSWLNNLGGTPAPAPDEQVASRSSSDEDLNWLNNLGSTPVSSSEEPAPAFDEPVSSQPISSEEDMSWLNNLGGTTEPSFEEPVPSQASSAQEDLDWLSSLGGTTETSEPFAGETVSQGSEPPSDKTSKPFRTAPLKELVGDEAFKDTTPDWLKSAMEEPSMPAPGAVSMDWFSEHSKPADAESVPIQEQPASSSPAFDFSLDESSATSAQDVDSLFDVEMPDWLSQEPESLDGSSQGAEAGIPAAGGDDLAPVELPSWVQAMRPVDSVIAESSASDVEQVTESEGPLAGFQGVIPSLPIGSSLRPKAFSLKLQITEEQQASAALLEQIVSDETLAQPQKEATGVSSQNLLRWALSALFLVVLGVVLGLGLKTMPINGSNQLSNLVGTIPESAPVLIVVDYEPSFIGEMEASAGPLLDQLALAKRSPFSFISMSPNSSALVDRLMLKTGISNLGYQPGEQYFNLGFLPGGSAGVLGFIENPADEFSKFEAVILMTDNAETGRVWVEQLVFAKGKYPSLAGKPLIVVSSAQSAPLLQPYVSSGQVDIMVGGLSDAVKYEYMNNTRPGLARSYWDAFGIGLTMALVAIILGSLWSVLMHIRERREEAEQV